MDQEELQQLLHYDPNTGTLTWKARSGDGREARRWNTRYAGETAGHKTSDGYVCVVIGGKQYKAHRLAWLYAKGRWPDLSIDHINGDPLDNRISNLRDVSHAENCRNQGVPKNNTSGHVGVCLNKRRKKWHAYYRHNGKNVHLGLFNCPTAAAITRMRADQETGLFHANHGRQVD